MAERDSQATTAPGGDTPPWVLDRYYQLVAWAARVGLGRKAAIALAIAALASGVATYVALGGSSPFGPDPRIVLVLLNIDLVLLLLLGIVVAQRLARVWIERRRGSVGARLHVRFVVLFGLVAVAPAIIVAVFSALFFNLGIQAWFSERVRTALESSVAVADAYFQEHQQAIRADALAMASDINRAAPFLLDSPTRFNQFVNAQANLRGLVEAVVFRGDGRILARASLTLSLEFADVSPTMIENARKGEAVLQFSDTDDRVRTLIMLDAFVDTFLLVGRFAESQVLIHKERVGRAFDSYRLLEGRRAEIQITFALIFVVVALLLLLAAVWVGLAAATRLVKPISELITATEQVRAGDLNVRLAEMNPGDEIGTLRRAFNRMTGQLQAQRGELLEANRQMDARRRFTETVLAGVSAGVLGLDAQGRIDLPNRSALELLGLDAGAVGGRNLADVLPELAPLLQEAQARPERVVQHQVELLRAGEKRTLLVRIAADQEGGAARSFVVTFDDITDLVVAQRLAAWGDVARRIAHEIKNPLTPIQLSAERLKRKYLKEIKSDPEVFAACTDTIVRQVDDIGRMVDEFSTFARMPAPVFRAEDIRESVQQVIQLQQVAHSDITHHEQLPNAPLVVECDTRQLRQAVTNLLRNAAEAIHAREAGAPPGHIEVSMVADDGVCEIAVRDNGRGLPVAERQRLTEPYVTTRPKGTGLGLTIVRKIMEDHDGELVLEDNPGAAGATVRLRFPIHGPLTAARGDRRRLARGA
ncbi:MAG: PAS domain-containing sensor histidine kinase [Alphaproteobacteria bacterium]|nr:PAS domain-containing sensor histidine kinase [Alphaproteobacteria bacterium]